MINIVKKKICITGGKGFLGQHLIKRLKDRGCRNLFIADIDVLQAPEYIKHPAHGDIYAQLL